MSPVIVVSPLTLLRSSGDSHFHKIWCAGHRCVQYPTSKAGQEYERRKTSSSRSCEPQFERKLYRSVARHSIQTKNTCAPQGWVQFITVAYTSFFFCALRYAKGKYGLLAIDQRDGECYWWRRTETFVCVRATKQFGSLHQVCRAAVSLFFSDWRHLYSGYLLVGLVDVSKPIVLWTC